MTAQKKTTDYAPKAGHFRLAGKEWPINTDADGDWEFMELVAASEEGSAAAVVNLAKFMLRGNEKAYEALKREATGDDGRVSTKQVSKLVQDMIKTAAPNS